VNARRDLHGVTAVPNRNLAPNLNLSAHLEGKSRIKIKSKSKIKKGTAPDPDAPYALCGNPSAGFSLLEVMIAMFVFFIVVFAVLGMVVQSLGAARALQRQHADCGIIASLTSLSNVLEESFDSGEFEGFPLPDYRWERTITEVGSNGLFQVDIVVFKKNARGQDIGEPMSILMFKPGGKRRRP
jgi:hypothetical protein